MYCGYFHKWSRLLSRLGLVLFLGVYVLTTKFHHLAAGSACGAEYCAPAEHAHHNDEDSEHTPEHNPDTCALCMLDTTPTETPTTHFTLQKRLSVIPHAADPLENPACNSVIIAHPARAPPVA